MIVFHNFAFMFDKFRNLLCFKREKRKWGKISCVVQCSKSKDQSRWELIRGAPKSSGVSWPACVLGPSIIRDVWVEGVGMRMESLLFMLKIFFFHFPKAEWERRYINLPFTGWPAKISQQLRTGQGKGRRLELPVLSPAWQGPSARLIICYLPGCISRKLDQKQRIWNLNQHSDLVEPAAPWLSPILMVTPFCTVVKLLIKEVWWGRWGNVLHAKPSKSSSRGVLHNSKGTTLM